jgi:hypothetical protein
VLDALEQAEMAARERRLDASNEAEEIVAAAKKRAAEISAAAGRRVGETLDELRRTAEADADAAIANLEREAAERAPPGTSQGPAEPRVEQAVATVVASVLGETAASTAEERA